MIYISNEIKTITLVRRGSFTPTDEVYELYLRNNYSNFNSCVELYDISENPKQFRFELSDEQFENLDYGEYNYILMNGDDKVYAGLIRVIQNFEPDVVYDWSHGDQPEPEPVYYDISITAGENGHLLIDGETYTVYTDTVLKGTRLTVEAVADNGYQINSWNDGNTSATRSFVVNSNITLLVAFEAVPVVTYHRVELYADPHGSIIVNGTEYIEDYIATLEEGTTLTVEASPFEGYQFDGWTDGSSVNPRTIVVSSDITLSAAFEAVPVVNYFQVAISAGNNGSVSVNGVVGNYNEQVEEGTVLTVVATPDQDYQFQGWSDGDLNQTRTITVTSNVTLSASFEAIPSTMYWVNINSGANGQVSVNGVVGNYSQQVPENTILSVEAIPATGYEFVSWNDGNTHAQRNITVTGDVQLQSSYQIMSFTVSIASDDTNEGTVTVNGTTGNYSTTMTYGSLLSFSATPATGYVFVEWSDGDTNASRITSVTSNITLTALFAVQTFNVSISGDAHTNVTVNGTPAPYTGTVNYGTQLSLVATSDTGYDFQGWSDGDVNTTRSITVTADTTLSCTSTIQTFSVSISAGNNGSVSVNGVSGNYSDTMNYGTQLALVATPDTGYNFTAWSDGNTSATRTVTVTGNLTLISSYSIQTLSVSITGDAHTVVTVDGTPAPYSHTVNYGTQLVLVATPDTGYNFTAWSDGNTSASRTITVTQNTTLSCASAIQTFNVSISSGNNGSVEVNGVSGNYNQTVNYGAQLTIEAVPDTWYNFEEWSDNVLTNPRTVTVTGNLTLTASFVVDTVPSDEIWYTSTDGQVVPITGYDFGATLVSNTYSDGKGVLKFDASPTSIGTRTWDNDKTKLRSLLLPNSVTNIKDQAFYQCSNLETVDISNVTAVGQFAFSGCTSLTSMYSGRVTSMKKGVFLGCTGLKSIIIQSTVTGISERAFKDCTSLELIDCRAAQVPTLGTDVFTNVKRGGVLKFDTALDYSTWLNFTADSGKSLALLGWNEMTQGVVCDGYYSILYDTQSHNYDVNIDYNSFYKNYSAVGEFYTNNNYGGIDYTGDCILMFENYPIVKISGAAFKDSTVTKVYLENNIAVMTGDIFSGNTYLRELRIPDSCTLFALSLNGCTNLRLLTIGKYTSYLYGAITSGCTSLNEIRFRSTEPPHSSTNNLFQDVASTGVMKVPYGSNLSLYTQILPSGWTLEQYSIS